MRAISIKQPWANQIAQGTKRVEYRTWKVATGPILIVASSTPGPGYAGEPRGVAVCTAEILRVTGEHGDYVWHLANVRPVEPEPVKGHAAIYKVDDARIRHVGPAVVPVAPKSAVKRKPRSKRGRYTFEEHESGAVIRGASEREAHDAYWRAYQLANVRGVPVAVLIDGCHTKIVEPGPTMDRAAFIAQIVGLPLNWEPTAPTVTAGDLARTMARGFAREPV